MFRKKKIIVSALLNLKATREQNHHVQINIIIVTFLTAMKDSFKCGTNYYDRTILYDMKASSKQYHQCQCPYCHSVTLFLLG